MEGKATSKHVVLNWKRKAAEQVTGSKPVSSVPSSQLQLCLQVSALSSCSTFFHGEL